MKFLAAVAAAIKAARAKKKKVEFSKRMTRLVIVFGFVIAQECLLLIGFAIYMQFEAPAAYLTAAVGLAETVIAASLNFYISMAKKEHARGGITYDALKAKGFENSENADTDVYDGI